MIPHRWRYSGTLAIYILVAGTFGAIGFRLAQGPHGVTNVYFAREPQTPPDRELSFYHHRPSSHITMETRDVVLIRERSPDDAINIVYFSPKRLHQWGVVEMEFRWEETLHPLTGILDPNLHLFGEFDHEAIGELALSSDATGNRWVTLATLGPSHTHASVQNLIDVTPWVRGCRSLRVRYRLNASRLMYHPTPNDPIGLAGAQCLRSGRTELTTRLRLWRDASAATYPSDG